MTQDARTTGKSHTLWIDVLKGIAIILVVYGHNCTDNRFVQAFHMPLFFLLSGFLFSSKPIKTYFKKSFSRLMLPYITFLIIIALPELALHLMKDDIGGGKYLILCMLYGGSYLKGPYAVFWFVSVLWMSTNLFNFIINRKWGLWLLPIFIGISYFVTFLPISLPFNIHIVPLATSFIIIGNLIKQQTDWIYNKSVDKMPVLIVISIIFLSLLYLFRDELTMDMKYNNPGIPIVSLISSIIASASMACLAIMLSRIKIIAKVLAFIGEASMIIMFIHMPVKAYLIAYFYPEGNHLLSFVCGMIISVSAYCLLKNFDLTRRIFLGQHTPKSTPHAVN